MPTTESLAEIEQMLDEWAESIELFVVECLGADPSENQQLEVLRDIDRGEKDIAIKSGHGTGKTTLLAWIILWVGLFKYDAKAPSTAPTAAQLVRLLIPEVKKWRDNLPVELKNAVNVKNDSIAFDTGNVAVARTARKESPEGLQGFHATFLLWVIDEASGIPLPIFEVIDGSLTGDDYLRIMAANPTRTSGYFYDACHRNRSLWKVHTFNAEESANVSKASIEKKKQLYGEDSDEYRVRVRGEFPRSETNSIFDLSLIERSMKKRDEVDRSGIFTIAVDVARFGDDKSIITKRKGYQIYGKEERSKLNTMEIASWVAHVARTSPEKPDAIFVDGVGLGAGVVDRLIQMGFDNVIEVNGSAAADDKRYANKRAEMYYGLAEWMTRGGNLPDDGSLSEELTATLYTYDRNGKIIVIPKEAIKEDLGRSPDTADSASMHFFTMIVPKAEQDNYNEEFEEEDTVW